MNCNRLDRIRIKNWLQSSPESTNFSEDMKAAIFDRMLKLKIQWPRISWPPSVIMLLLFYAIFTSVRRHCYKCSYFSFSATRLVTAHNTNPKWDKVIIFVVFFSENIAVHNRSRKTRLFNTSWYAIIVCKCPMPLFVLSTPICFFYVTTSIILPPFTT